MTRREYRDLAYILHLSKEDFKSTPRMRFFVNVICNWLQANNPRFNHALFIEAVYDPKFWDLRPETRAKQQIFFKEK